jgi:hypothetical protein
MTPASSTSGDRVLAGLEPRRMQAPPQMARSPSGLTYFRSISLSNPITTARAALSSSRSISSSPRGAVPRASRRSRSRRSSSSVSRTLNQPTPAVDTYCIDPRRERHAQDQVA